MDSSSEWDDLRKQARKVESQVYSKLCEYTPAASSAASVAIQIVPSSSSSSTSSSSSFSSQQQERQITLEKEIESLLSRLSGIVDSMSRCLSSDSSTHTEANSYTLQRYRAILHDYNHEYRKHRETIVAARQRAELLSRSSGGSSDAEDGESGGSGGLRGRTEQLVKEKSTLHHSLNLTDSIIQQAMDARESLHRQQLTLASVAKSLRSLGTRFPVVNQLMGQISSAKQREMIVLACVFAGCLCFTFVYIMAKP